MFATGVIATASRIATQRARFPVERRRRDAFRAPAQALQELGVAVPAELSEDYQRAVAELFPVLHERALHVGMSEQARKLERPDLPAHTAKQLLYLAVRSTRPAVAVETGTFSGATTTFILRALQDNGGESRLVSLDLPAWKPIPRAIDAAIPQGEQPGWLIPDELRDRLELVIGDARRTLPSVLDGHGPIGLFFHDSLHTWRHMRFEYRAAWAALAPGALLLSDDVFMTSAFWWHAARMHVPFLHVGNAGVMRKPPA